MSYAIVWEAKATGMLSRFLDDPKGAAAVLDAVDRLSQDPRPASAFPYGDVDRRLRVGRYRVWYAIDDQVKEVHVAYVDRV
ncbi:type II toxin-antitoxin system RelE/ParE family toxin [Actinomadura sp. LD22]|uniref:Type II toxin-antitoxin system RelE/ParE family toxin n=1 Tax=Actinomadura physcomitrii TaxID=2650748 RepID=A0A6I4M6W4_9ACTN|nr:type II toxin-antitoxin system RelE/ParE family toxin [Actinomadura physcomitrii]MVZ99500.1 type II toxin-antitoxin system RelE/ParE family toxin [Actinomadura physcomitrii]